MSDEFESLLRDQFDDRYDAEHEARRLRHATERLSHDPAEDQRIQDIVDAVDHALAGQAEHEAATSETPPQGEPPPETPGVDLPMDTGGQRAPDPPVAAMHPPARFPGRAPGGRRHSRWSAGHTVPSDFLIWLSGTEAGILEHAPADRAKYVGIGGAILTAGTLVTASMFLALRMAGGTPVWAAVILSAVWFLIMVNLDRYLVVSLQRSQSTPRTLLGMLPRVFLALLIGAVMSAPLVLQVFDREVQVAVSELQADASLRFQKELADSPSGQRIRVLERQEGDLRAKITAGNRPGQVQEAKQTLSGVQGELQRLRAAQKDQQEVFERANSGDSGLLIRLKGLDKASEGDSRLQWARLLLFLFITILGCLPVIMKALQLFGPPSAYDYALEKHREMNWHLLQDQLRSQQDIGLMENSGLEAYTRMLHSRRTEMLEDLVERTLEAETRVYEADLSRWLETQLHQIQQRSPDHHTTEVRRP
ncbi:uncharacterized protein DUF4407 [Actinomadura pelletieri DSM 43383]|uniref:Uncharacterized protein DUF4407 n=1 Tax=Actinomadura pelletieri DSM 43383 TaxID=1120940 RepID=A0A495QFH1_9ACTN|nr:DUF4407 domain-containing protein [Actinomadura pelletieri]RKS70672.1 uncharacterized protein DUF4407 [Actinomadura pelletieri DSM 43383]